MGFGSPPGMTLPSCNCGLVNFDTPWARMHLACASIDSYSFWVSRRGSSLVAFSMSFVQTPSLPPLAMYSLPGFCWSSSIFAQSR